jgi:hypothetical protein
MGRENEISRGQEPAPPGQGGVSYDQAMEGTPNFYDRKYNELPAQLGDRGAQMPPEGEPRQQRPGGKSDCDWRPNPNSQSELTQAWKQASQERMGLPMQLDANGEYTVAFGDSLGAVAMRNLRTSGAPASGEDIKAEVARIAALNKDRYPSLDCNVDLIREGWHLRVGPPGRGQVDAPTGPPRERPPERLPERPPEQGPPEQGRRRGNTVNIYHIDADTVRINGGANGGIPQGYDGPRRPPQQREPIYDDPRRGEAPPVRYDPGYDRGYDRPLPRRQERIGYEEPYTRIIIGGNDYGQRYQPQFDPRFRYQDPRFDYANRQDPWSYAAMDGQQWYRNYQYSQDPRFAGATGQRYIDPRMMDPRYLDPRMDPRLAYRYGRAHQQPSYYDPNCDRRYGRGGGGRGMSIRIGIG